MRPLAILPKNRRGMRPGTPVELANIHRKFRSEYRAWAGMRTRCRNAKSKDFRLYGGRGIMVCERWNSFAAFLADIGPKPSAVHSIDRIDSNGHYEPSNCRWATPKEQANNWAARNARFSLAGENLTQSQWCERLGITSASFRDRLASSWPIERILTTPAIRTRTRDGSGRYASE